PGTSWRGTGLAFTRNQVPCTLLARWEAGYKDPWLILTDLAPEASDAGWYGLRAWIEQGFKITKRAGWQWQRTRMTDPAPPPRLWLAVAVATLWLLSVGGAADETIPASTLLDVTALCPERPRSRRATRLRLVSVFRQGWVTLLVALLRQEPLPEGRFVPEPWPVVPPLAAEGCELSLAMPEAARGTGGEPLRHLRKKRMHSQHLIKTSSSKTGRGPATGRHRCLQQTSHGGEVPAEPEQRCRVGCLRPLMINASPVARIPETRHRRRCGSKARHSASALQRSASSFSKGTKPWA